jgi:hypothetical protein
MWSKLRQHLTVMGNVKGWLSILGLTLVARTAHAQAPADTGGRVMGVRYGFSASSLDDPFHQSELYLNLDLPSRRPWRLQGESGWLCQTRIDFSAGALNGQSQNGFIGSVGPAFHIGNLNFPLFFDAGSSFTYLSRHEFGPTDFGAALQFTTHVGLRLRLTSKLTLAYRLQHMSTAGQSKPNPGLDLHNLGIDYRF